MLYWISLFFWLKLIAVKSNFYGRYFFSSAATAPAITLPLPFFSNTKGIWGCWGFSHLNLLIVIFMNLIHLYYYFECGNLR